jgi:tetratricopeptide (TPR) repeat protein
MPSIWRPAVVVLLLAVNAIAGLEEDLAVGFDHFYNLEYDEAIAAFEKAARANPTSPLPQDGVAQSVLYREMFRNGALESELIDGTNSFLRRPKMEASQATTDLFFNAINKALELSQKEIERNPRDKRALHARAVALAFRSNWNFLVRKAWRDSLSDATAARKAEDQILAIDPKDPDARLGEGVHEYIIGCLPWGWRALGFLVGFRGDKVHGLATVEEISRHGTINKPDAEIMLCAFYRREREPKKAIPLLDDLIRRYPRNYLLRFEQSKMYSDYGDKKNALGVLEEIQRLKETRSPGFVNAPMIKIYFERATIEFWYRDLDLAIADFNRTMARPDDVDLNTGAFSYLRLGQIMDMKGKHPQAVEFYKKAQAFAPEADASKESRKYMSTAYVRK